MWMACVYTHSIFINVLKHTQFNSSEGVTVASLNLITAHNILIHLTHCITVSVLPKELPQSDTDNLLQTAEQGGWWCVH